MAGTSKARFSTANEKEKTMANRVHYADYASLGWGPFNTDSRIFWGTDPVTLAFVQNTLCEVFSSPPGVLASVVHYRASGTRMRQELGMT